MPDELAIARKTKAAAKRKAIQAIVAEAEALYGPYNKEKTIERIKHLLKRTAH